jgi:hypothetical protein
VEKALRIICGGGLPKEEADGSLTVNVPAGQAQMALNFNPDEDI